MMFTERLEKLPDWVLDQMFVRYRDKPFSHKNRRILRAISNEQGTRETLKHRLDLLSDLR